MKKYYEVRNKEAAQQLLASEDWREQLIGEYYELRQRRDEEQGYLHEMRLCTKYATKFGTYTRLQEQIQAQEALMAAMEARITQDLGYIVSDVGVFSKKSMEVY